MRNLRKAMGLLGAIAGFSTLTAMLTIGCSGDDNKTDGGTDSGPDVTTDSGKDVVQSDVVVSDAADAGDAADVINPIDKFRADLGAAVCQRYQNCCKQMDAGPFDYNTCDSVAVNNFWNGSNTEISLPGVVARGNVQLNSTSVASCLAGVATLSCPAITSSEVTALTANCFAATTGTLTAGANCIASVECQPGNYCKFAGVDAGTTDAGATLGVCTTLIGDGGLCGQALPYGDPNFMSEECAYKGWPPPAEFCNYDSYPTASGYHCAPLRADATQCYFDNECASSLCGQAGQDCVNTTCSCTTSRDLSPVCAFFAIKDAGTD